MTRHPLALIVPLMIALLAACVPTEEGPPGTATWTGELSLHSSSVPGPYNWGKVATLGTEGVDLSVTYWPRDSKNSQSQTKQWTRQLTGDQWAQVDAIVRDFDPQTGEPAPPGSCWITVALDSTDGTALDFSTAPGDPNYARALELYELLAGPDDVELPKHSFQCPTR